MMRRAGVLALFLWLAGVVDAIAEPVVLRSGEHDGFSRLVLPIGEATAWSLKQSGRRATLTLNRPRIEFDTSRVFDRIPRKRLVALGQDGPAGALVQAPQDAAKGQAPHQYGQVDMHHQCRVEEPDPRDHLGDDRGARYDQ